MKEEIPAKVRVRQVKGSARRTKEVKATLSALGLGRVGKERVHNVNPALVGMLSSVEYLIEVSPAD